MTGALRGLLHVPPALTRLPAGQPKDLYFYLLQSVHISVGAHLAS